MFEPALRSLRLGGRQVAITSTGERRVTFDLVDFYHNLSQLIGVDSMKFTPRDMAAIAEELRPGFEAMFLKLLLFKLFRFQMLLKPMNERPAVMELPSRCLPSRSFGALHTAGTWP